MRAEAFVVFTRGGFEKLTKSRPPKLGAGQFAVRLVLEVPDELFSPAIPTARLQVPESAVLTPQFTLDLDAMEEICPNPTLVAADETKDGKYRCPACDYRHWKADVGAHYKPTETEVPA